MRVYFLYVTADTAPVFADAYSVFNFDSSCIPAGCGSSFEPPEQQRRPLLLWWPTESGLRPGLPSATAQLHTAELLAISRQHISVTWQIIYCFQWQLSAVGGLALSGRIRRGRTGRRGREHRRGVHGTGICRRERADGAGRPRDALDQAGVWGQPAGGRPGDRERQRGECVVMLTERSPCVAELLVVGCARLDEHRFPLSYQHQYWHLILPVCTNLIGWCLLCHRTQGKQRRSMEPRCNPAMHEVTLFKVNEQCIFIIP